MNSKNRSSALAEECSSETATTPEAGKYPQALAIDQDLVNAYFLVRECAQKMGMEVDVDRCEQEGVRLASQSGTKPPASTVEDREVLEDF